MEKLSKERISKNVALPGYFKPKNSANNLIWTKLNVHPNQLKRATFVTVVTGIVLSEGNLMGNLFRATERM